MKNFTFYNPTKMIFGKDTISHIGDVISSYKYKSVLLVAGSGSIKRNGVYDKVIESLQANNIRVVEHWGVRPNPTLDHVNIGIKLAQTEKVDAVLAVGGGSTIDAAKSICIGYYVQDVWKVYERIVSVENALPLFTVLTLSATGSEMNAGAVLSNEAERKKWATGSPLMFPKVTIIDPSVQMTLPWNQTVNGAIDTISHIQELYFFGKNQESTLTIDESIIRTVIRVTNELQQKSNDYNARANLAWSASLALSGLCGAGFDNGDWSVHWLEHGISAVYPEVAHGAGLGVLYPAWILVNQKYNPDTFGRWARNIWSCNTIEDGVKAFKSQLKSWKAPITLNELNVDLNTLVEYYQEAMKISSVGNYNRLSIEDITQILELAN